MAEDFADFLGVSDMNEEPFRHMSPITFYKYYMKVFEESKEEMSANSVETFPSLSVREHLEEEDR